MHKFSLSIIKSSNVLYYFVFILLTYSFQSCTQEKTRKIKVHDNVAPGEVENIQVENLHGAARISYDIPEDLDLLYVLAKFEIREGVDKEIKSSFYSHHIEIEGFGDTSTHVVTLYAVDRSGNKSKGVKVNVKPLLSPVQMAYASLSYKSDFGGINITFQNKTQADIITTILIKDELGEWKNYDNYYTSIDSIDYSSRGLPSVSTTFGVYIQDPWDNISDTLVKDIVPLFEKELNKSKFSYFNLPNDAELTTWPDGGFWNGNNDQYGLHTGETAGFPVWVTIDLGVTTQLSRLKVWQVRHGREYSEGNVRQFEVWGSTNPNPDGLWDDSWTLLQNCEVIKPSGLPPGEISNEDAEQANAGHEFSIPGSAPQVRYIRLKLISSFSQPPGSSTGSAWFREITIWGN